MGSQWKDEQGQAATRSCTEDVGTPGSGGAPWTPTSFPDVLALCPVSGGTLRTAAAPGFLMAGPQAPASPLTLIPKTGSIDDKRGGSYTENAKSYRDKWTGPQLQKLRLLDRKQSPPFPTYPYKNHGIE